jgi:hypothetical protein
MTRIRIAGMTAQENPILLFFAFAVVIAAVISLRNTGGKYFGLC